MNELRQLILTHEPKEVAQAITLDELRSVINQELKQDMIIAQTPLKDQDWILSYEDQDKEYAITIIRAILKGKANPPQTIIQKQVAAMPANSIELFKQMIQKHNEKKL